MTNISAGVEIDRNQRLREEIVPWPYRTVEIGRWIAYHEIDVFGVEVDGRVLSNTPAEGLVRIAGLGVLSLLGGYIAMQVATHGVVCRPNAN